jgi:hypothetical protein
MNGLLSAERWAGVAARHGDAIAKGRNPSISQILMRLHTGSGFRSGD